MTKSLVSGAKLIIETLLDHGFEAYMVGGSVRDMVLKRNVKDYDIATSAKPEQVQQLFTHTIPTGLQHGTVTVVWGGHVYEVTTYRKESGYEDFRRPSEVEYIDNLYEDLRRRDFTMNAMAMSLEGEIIDPFNGMADIDDKVLRCVGEAPERFHEDALRMLRCIRFAAEFELHIEEQTWAALLAQAPLLNHIAMERVRMELERMVAGANPERAVKLLACSRLLALTKEALLLAHLPQEQLSPGWGHLPEPAVKWAYLYLLVRVTPVQLEQELRKLTFAKQRVEEIRRVVAAVYELAGQPGQSDVRSAQAAGGQPVGTTGESQAVALTETAAPLERGWKLAALEYGAAALGSVIELARRVPQVLQLSGISAEACKLISQHGADWLQEMPVQRIDQLDVRGKELLSHIGQPAGPWVAQVLQHLLRETALQRLANDKPALLAEAERIAKTLNTAQ
ncbi:CCA tRNA nucleotidyltransferase [Paenibacillus xerothermodurans]|uniref:CCA tRNA nucleotidyltransferase n=1 Tax=Paenibacillus xerothermodurans TaxID=1977292 RepID=A0A2W1P466_PAEXE|nr:CCA tRNA nucleotidyltransferase [Paenibacillus xerothermodurans]PZE21918.1 CCA tRNA nucleotidyltransferase [Paenibacillus xerothermodurans]